MLFNNADIKMYHTAYGLIVVENETYDRIMEFLHRLLLVTYYYYYEI